MYNVQAKVENKVLTITIDLKAPPKKGSLGTIASTDGEMRFWEGLRLQLYLYLPTGANKYLRK